MDYPRMFYDPAQRTSDRISYTKPTAGAGRLKFLSREVKSKNETHKLHKQTIHFSRWVGGR